jgi:hypothetical protein
VATSIPICLLVALILGFPKNIYRHKFRCSDWTSIFVTSAHRNFLSRIGDGRNLKDSIEIVFMEQEIL